MARKLFGGGDCGELVIEGTAVKLKVLPSGKMVGVGKKFAGFSINPEDVIVSS